MYTSTHLKNKLPEEAAELAAAPALLAPWAKAPPLAVFAAEAAPVAPDATALAPAPTVHRLGVKLQTTVQVVFDVSALHTVQYSHGLWAICGWGQGLGPFSTTPAVLLHGAVWVLPFASNIGLPCQQLFVL
jgi:hypothetical protein